jgi:hypothetical protein
MSSTSARGRRALTLGLGLGVGISDMAAALRMHSAARGGAAFQALSMIWESGNQWR